MIFTSVSRISAASLVASRRLIHVTPVAYKTMTEKVSEVADKINKEIGKGLASAIETGEKVTESAKQTIGSATEQTKKTTNEASQMASEKKDQVAAGMHEAKDSMAKHMKK